MKNDDPINLLKRFGAAITSVIGIVTALVGAFKLWKQEPSMFTICLLALGLGAVLVSLGFVRFRARMIKSSITGESIVERAYSPRARRLALFGLIAVPLFVVAGVATWLHVRSLPSNKVRVLIAEFDGPEPKKYRVTDNILRRLREATSKYDDVEIEALGEVITEQQGSKVAREKGKEKKASIVLWGWYAATGVQAQMAVNFEVLKKSEQWALEKNQLTVNASIAQLETFAIQTLLSSEMSYLTLLALGLIRYEATDYDAAISFFSDALIEQNLPKALVEPTTIYLYRGNAYNYKGNYDRAMADFNHAIQLKPDDANAYNNRGIVYGNKGDYDCAFADFDYAILLDPDDANAYNNRGIVYGNKGDHDRAIRDFNHAIQLKPDDAGAYSNRGATYSRKGEFDSTIADFDHAIQLKVDFSDAYYNRGIAYGNKGDHERAIGDFDKAIRLKPDDAEAYYNRGVAYGNMGDYDRAIDDFDQAIRLRSDYVSAYNNRGIAHKEKGDHDRAIADYNQAILLQPDSASVYVNRGFAYVAMKQRASAIADFQKALKLGKDQILIQLAQKQLRKLGVEVP